MTRILKDYKFTLAISHCKMYSILEIKVNKAKNDKLLVGNPKNTAQVIIYCD
jgi:hypothetical protein